MEDSEHRDDQITNIINPIIQGTQLSLIGAELVSLPAGLCEEHGNVITRLDLSFNCLRTLVGLESFSNLQELVLDNNEIDDQVRIPRLPQLHTLMINKNKITDLEVLLEQLKKQLPCLTYISLLGNIACPNELSASDKDEEDYKRYRCLVLYHLPNLKFLDSKRITKREREEAKRKGPFLKVVKPNETTSDSHEGQSSPDLYTPLPQVLKEGGQHQGTFGQCKYVYYGRHSEGNRFIRNTDL
ncbi:leucine-rich melanocyte differentiation-associated protein-like [Anneissia japonica]|uniref:leucine-rich melanocyte differentiation-associated protein-like n=1 Tax=Anneissia japonica TaxID=1529436 RepID=UPI001425B989|nr:leucine-rich melanocyte differentiation-associated protein-like [Anneissia japonica]